MHESSRCAGLPETWFHIMFLRVIFCVLLLFSSLLVRPSIAQWGLPCPFLPCKSIWVPCDVVVFHSPRACVGVVSYKEAAFRCEQPETSWG